MRSSTKYENQKTFFSKSVSLIHSSFAPYSHSPPSYSHLMHTGDFVNFIITFARKNNAVNDILNILYMNAQNFICPKLSPQ